MLALLSSCKACTLQVAAVLVLDGDGKFWRDEYDEPVPNTTAGKDAAVRWTPAPRRDTRGLGQEVRGPKVTLANFLAKMPGVGNKLPESEMLVSILHTNILHSALRTYISLLALDIWRRDIVCECWFSYQNIVEQKVLACFCFWILFILIFSEKLWESAGSGDHKKPCWQTVLQTHKSLYCCVHVQQHEYACCL